MKSLHAKSPGCTLVASGDHMITQSRGRKPGATCHEGMDSHKFPGLSKPSCVMKDEYILTPIRYNHQNPVRAKMVRKAEDYPYSGHRSYAKGQVTEVVDPRLVLEMLGTESIQEIYRARGAVLDRCGYAREDSNP